MPAAVLFALLIGSAAQESSPPPKVSTQKPKVSTQKETRRRFDLVATRAVANFHAADSIEQRLNQDGATLHPQLVALRLRIDAAIREARGELERGNLTEAGEALDRAEALLDRFARKLGGD